MPGVDYFTFTQGAYSSDYMEKNEKFKIDYTMSTTYINFCN